MKAEDVTLGGHWLLTTIMIVVVGWIVFKYLAPRNLKEWRNAGLLQAFVIALYAEMYGFPLTIYLLTSLLGVQIPWLHVKGHLWATLLGLGEAGAMVEMLIGYAIVFLGIVMLFQGWKQIYRSRYEHELVTKGIYGYVRHPQYTGLFLALTGQLIHWPTLPTLVLFPAIVWLYYRLARREERDMLEQFGRQYQDYMNRVPMFFQKRQNLRAMLGELI